MRSEILWARRSRSQILVSFPLLESDALFSFSDFGDRQRETKRERERLQNNRENKFMTMEGERRGDREMGNGGTTGGGEMEVVCSLCGDMGFQNALILCRKCGFRLQHTYCSRLYPDIDMDRWSCEWCLHEEEHSKRKRSKVFEFLLEIAESFLQGASTSGCDSHQIKRICREDHHVALPAEEKRLQIGTGINHCSSNTESREKAGASKKNARCLEKNKALDRWRSLARTKFGGCRRYKLLADVHC